MNKPVSRLGKGLSALISAHPSPLETPPPAASSAILHIRLDDIAPNPRQPRSVFDETSLAELAESIKTHGILQPVLVRPLTEGKFELVAGERRLRAARLAALPTIPAIVRQLTESDATEAALVENLQRDDLNPIDRAVAYRHYLRLFNAVPDRLATRLGESRASVANYLRLLTLPEEIQEMLADGRLGMGHARAILGLPPERQVAVARLAFRRNLSVRQLEALAARSPEAAPPASEDAEIRARSLRRRYTELGQTLSRAVGLRVTVAGGRRKNSGRVVIHYNTLDEFDALAQRLGAPTSIE